MKTTPVIGATLVGLVLGFSNAASAVEAPVPHPRPMPPAAMEPLPAPEPLLFAPSSCFINKMSIHNAEPETGLIKAANTEYTIINLNGSFCKELTI